MPDPLEPRVHLAALPGDMGEVRSILAADRTLMAWIRTSLSMFSFGFTIYKFLQGMQAKAQMEQSNSPQQVGLFLVGMGVTAMMLGTLSYWTTLRELERTEKFSIGRPVLLMALIMSVAGIAMFVSIATRSV